MRRCSVTQQRRTKRRWAPDKTAVRRAARALALPRADKPAAPCLASRIPHFSPVDQAKLAQVERAEAELRRLGFTDLRVRHHGEVARLELPSADLARAVTEPLRAGARGGGRRGIPLRRRGYRGHSVRYVHAATRRPGHG
jgi:PP-loop superfamily ATP-utilizing enzyme